MGGFDYVDANKKTVELLNLAAKQRFMEMLDISKDITYYKSKPYDSQINGVQYIIENIEQAIRNELVNSITDDLKKLIQLIREVCYYYSIGKDPIKQPYLTCSIVADHLLRGKNVDELMDLIIKSYLPNIDKEKLLEKYEEESESIEFGI